MATLIFDIETTPLKEDAPSLDALSPATAKLATLSVYDVERDQGTVYINNESRMKSVFDNWHLKIMTEAELLFEFWQGVQDYDVYAGFSIRRFDVPFITHRSIAYGVRTTDRLQNRRVIAEQHPPFLIDLFDEFSFHGNMSKPLSLRSLSDLYKIQEEESFENPEAFLKLYKNEDLGLITKHCIQKSLVTARLYQHWLTSLAPSSFLNTIALL